MFWAGQSLLKELPTPPDQQKLDLVGAAAGTVAIGAAVTAIMQGRIWGYTSALTALVAAVGVLSFVVFISNSFRHPEPLLNLHLLRRRGVMVANLVNFLVGITSQSIWIVCTIHEKRMELLNVGSGHGGYFGTDSCGVLHAHIQSISWTGLAQLACVVLEPLYRSQQLLGISLS